MLKRKQPTYEVSFLERHEDSGLGRRWVSAAVSGFNEGTSRYQQVERILGELGTPVIDGDFKMRRMKADEVKSLRKSNRHLGGTPVSHTQQVDGGLEAIVAYPEEVEDLLRVRSVRMEKAAEMLASIEMVQNGTVNAFGLFESGLGWVTGDNADALEARIRDQVSGPLYGNEHEFGATIFSAASSSA